MVALAAVWRVVLQVQAGQSVCCRGAASWVAGKRSHWQGWIAGGHLKQNTGVLTLETHKNTS